MTTWTGVGTSSILGRKESREKDLLRAQQGYWQEQCAQQPRSLPPVMETSSKAQKAAHDPASPAI